MIKTITNDQFTVAIEDWNYAGTITKDAYFRNLRVYSLDSSTTNEL